MDKEGAIDNWLIVAGEALSIALLHWIVFLEFYISFDTYQASGKIILPN